MSAEADATFIVDTFDEIPTGATFADKFGRIYKKTGDRMVSECGEVDQDHEYLPTADELHADWPGIRNCRTFRILELNKEN